MNSKFDDLVRSLDPQTLEELRRSVAAELGGRREETAIQLEQIHPKMSADAREVIGAAAVLGRRFDWALLGPVAGLADAAVVAALHDGVSLQLIVAERDSFRFRHALTHEAVLAGLLPPERALLAGRALTAVEAAHPGLPGAWCMLAANFSHTRGTPKKPCGRTSVSVATNCV